MKWCIVWVKFLWYGFIDFQMKCLRKPSTISGHTLDSDDCLRLVCDFTAADGLWRAGHYPEVEKTGLSLHTNAILSQTQNHRIIHNSFGPIVSNTCSQIVFKSVNSFQFKQLYGCVDKPLELKTTVHWFGLNWTLDSVDKVSDNVVIDLLTTFTDRRDCRLKVKVDFNQ